MAGRGVQFQMEHLSCSLCLQLLKEPLTTSCGHSYCRACISSFWDGEEEKKVFSCPQCRETFRARPVLMKNFMLADLVEQLKESGLHDDPGDPSFASDEDVACDVCTGRKVKASKSCLNCVASYCEEHLQPHRQSAALKRHRLVDPSKKLQENICSLHDEVMKMFCRTDQQCICSLCSVDDHKDHDVVTAAAEQGERQRELQESRAEIQKNIQDKERDMEQLEEQLKNIQLSADQTVDQSQQMFTELIRLLHRRSSELEQEVRSKQQTEASAVRALQEKLQQELSELKKRDAELQQILLTEDHVHFVQSCSSMSALSVSTLSSISHTGSVSLFQEVTAAASQLSKRLQDILRDGWTDVCRTVERGTLRAGLLQYSQEVSLDPNTAHRRLRFSEGNRKVTVMEEDQHHPDHPHRFTLWYQVLSRESYTGPWYWEVEWTGIGVGVAVSYKSIDRTAGGGFFGFFGYNNKSWMLICRQNRYTFIHNNVWTSVPGGPSSRIGVYVDPTEATLSFYSITDTMTLLHRVNTTFSEPLHAGVYLYYTGDTAELCEL